MRTEVKCDSVDNNMCEAFNGTIVKARSKPIVKMLEDIRVATMTRIARCRKQVEKWPGNFGPRIMKKLNENIVESIGWHVDFNGNDGYEIKKGMQQFKVKLQAKTCSCRSWDLTGIPCAHACCAIFDLGKDPEQYIDQCYSKEVYKRIYSHTIQPLNGEISWPRTNCEEILAPLPRRMTGRPKKKRTREPTEPPIGKISRQGRVMTCSICKQKGHQNRVCPAKSSMPPTALASVAASTSITASASPSVAASTSVGASASGSASTTRKSKQRKTSGGGFGVYINPNTGAQILNPGRRGQQVLLVGGKTSATAAKKKQ
ncbi:PREDICTED: uncharacterized protein LOC109181378 [Ipomoea nil]|uniref:uncharacterized protein LOC109181378 n=1 Tax=Ipomoea nil TaxID=35883 RepID=UPI00090166AF|nr:PREDICTED: uncharacterized protein LOC109181378 [Ipomoea nil]